MNDPRIIMLNIFVAAVNVTAIINEIHPFEEIKSIVVTLINAMSFIAIMVQLFRDKD